MRRCILLITTILALAHLPVGAQTLPALQQLRSNKREASRIALSQPDKSDEPQLFGLLVIPVDFSDARLPAGWDGSSELSPLLHPLEGETLHNYFTVASGNKLDLRITLAPVVHLEGTRRNYSDRYLIGSTRTRALAHESISAARDMGLIFRALDMEGPDRIPGSADDDGDLDGILILHAGVGQENDSIGGWIQALQYYLEEPVVSEGITASFYAVASMHSGLGIWAHETAHLLGMEDRYDPILRPEGGSELQSRGGLGRFSLMASGAWGTGDGAGCALPDAYSAMQLGWQQPIILPASSSDEQILTAAASGGTCARIWTEEDNGPEFFLLETRDPVTAAPFDAAISGDYLLVYHIDENVPEGGWLVEGANQYHLRAHLVEADGDDSLRLGLDDGNWDDLFPGSTGNTHLGGSTLPSSDGYNGSSQVEITGITSYAGSVGFNFSAAVYQTITFSSSFSLTMDGWILSVNPTSVGRPLTALNCTIQALGADPHGSFAGGVSQVDVAFSSSDGIHWTTDQTPLWIPDTIDLEGKQTAFRYDFIDPNTGWTQYGEIRTWLWQGDSAILDFASQWPGQWIIDHPEENTNTTWHRWDGEPFLTSDQTPVLACTGSSYTSAENWDAISYQNNAWTTLTSGPIGAETVAVRIIHAAEIEFIGTELSADGAVLTWVGPDGDEIQAVPVQPWTAKVDPSVAHPLRSWTTFGSASIDTLQGGLCWRDDVIPIPAGAGPWQLKFTFASNPLWRYKGWFVASIEPLETLDESVLFQAANPPDARDSVIWNWPHPASGDVIFQIQAQQVETGVWETILEEMFEPIHLGNNFQVFSISANKIFSAQAQQGRTRNLLRIVGSTTAGKINSNAFVLYQDGGQPQNLIMAKPWPNPTLGSVKLDMKIPTESSGVLKIYDLAGRCVFTRNFPGGNQFYLWEGIDKNGEHLSSGTYFIKLDGPGFSELNKVVLIH